MLKAAAMLLALVLAAGKDGDQPENGLTVHEWGTFTTVAGPDGHPVQWQPLAGPSDLPCFVDRLGSVISKYTSASGIKYKVRMETPVLYFYGRQPATLNVRVDFRNGMITEWYPRGNVTPPGNSIHWKNVELLPGTPPDLPFEGRPSHYYAARETDATPVRVGGQDEQFLFYRGVGNFRVPLSAQTTVGGQTLISVAGNETLPAIILFENRSGQIGYRIEKRLHGTAVVEPPALNADAATLRSELETILIAQGLYPREARAMIETWRDSWFEEGTRVFYIVPAHMVDAILPLQIDPPPAKVSRVFVGRMEIITSATVQAVEGAIAGDDTVTLARFGRFLGPITDRIVTRPQIRALVDATYKSFLDEVSSTCK